MKKILLITLEYPPQKGGVASYYFGLVEELRRQGYEVQVISQALLSKWFWPRWLRGYVTVRAAVKREKPDMFFVGHILPLGTVAYLLRKRVPYVVFTHGMDVLMAQKSWRKRWLLKKILVHAKLIVASSEFTKAEIGKIGRGEKLTIVNFSPQSIIVYPCPNTMQDATLEDVEALRQRLGLGGKKVLLTLGRVVERKGHDLVIRALLEILKHVPEAVYIVAGVGSYLGKLGKMVEELKLQNVVRFVGAVSDEDRALYFSFCDLFVMPSRQIGSDVEGFGIVFLEAAMFGKPSIGGRSGGIPEAILDGKTGALVDPNDPAAFARIVVQLLRDDALRHELGQNAKARVMHEFRWEKQVGKLKM